MSCTFFSFIFKYLTIYGLFILERNELHILFNYIEKEEIILKISYGGMSSFHLYLSI